MGLTQVISSIRDLLAGAPAQGHRIHFDANGRAVPRLSPQYDVRDYGAAVDNVTSDTAAVQAAIDAAEAAGGGTVLIPGKCYVPGGLTVQANGITLLGTGRRTSELWTNSGDLITLTSASRFSCRHMKVRSTTGGGHVFTLTNSLSHGLWFDLDVVQVNAAKSILQADDAGAGTLNYIDNLWLHIETLHTNGNTATVPTFNLRGGAINRNRWSDMRPTYSGEYVWLIETTAASSYANDNTIEGITGEVLKGGIVKALGHSGLMLRDIGNYDLHISGTTRDQVYLGSSATGLPTRHVTLENVRRVGSGLTAGTYDLSLNGSPGSIMLINCGSTATSFEVNANAHRLLVLDGSVTVTNGTAASYVRSQSTGSSFYDPVEFRNKPIRLTPIALPATCTVGDLCVDTADKKVKVCTATDTWTVVGAQT